MAITLLDAVDFTKVPALGFVVPVVGADPAGYEAGLIYNSSTKEVKYHNGTAWVALGPAGAGGPPTGAAGGDLTGSYPTPQIAAGVIVDADVNASAAIAQSKIANLTTDLSARVLKAGDTMGGFLTLNADPTADLHAATKKYVDITSQGFSFKNAVRLVAVGNITQSGLITVDGQTTVANDRILCAGQTTQTQNGIWLAQSGAWTRAPDMDATGELTDGTLVPVGYGTGYADTLWMCSTVSAVPWVPGTVNSYWTKFTSLTDLVAGAGMIKTGSTLDIQAGNGTIQVNTDSIAVLSAPKWTTPVSFSLTGDVTGSTPSVDGSGNVSIATTVVNAGKRFSGDVGAGSAVVITHNLNTRDVSVTVYRTTTPWDTVQCGVERTTVNTVTLKFAVAVSAAAYRAVVVG